jgi:hypothetical protein
VRAQRVQMRLGCVTFVSIETICRMLYMQLDHHCITRRFGKIDAAEISLIVQSPPTTARERILMDDNADHLRVLPRGVRPNDSIARRIASKLACRMLIASISSTDGAGDTPCHRITLDLDGERLALNSVSCFRIL